MHFRCLILFPFILCGLVSSAQKILISGTETSRLLTWNDFNGKPDNGNPHFAYTYWNVSFSMDAYQFKGDTAKWQVMVSVELGKNSWKKKDKVSDTLLKHEQGHFDIGIICAMEIQQIIDNTAFTRPNHVEKLNKIIKTTIDKYAEMEKKYDEETKHFADRPQQWKWDAYFASKIPGRK